MAVLGLNCSIFSYDACGLGPRPGMKPKSPALGTRSLSHWTSWENSSMLTSLCLFYSQDESKMVTAIPDLLSIHVWHHPERGSFLETCSANRDRLSWWLLINFSLILAWLSHALSPKSTTDKGDRMTVKPTRTFLKLMVRFTSKGASELCWVGKRGESWTKSEFSENGESKSGGVVSQHYSIQEGIVWVWGNGAGDHYIS